jgi:hypothetical protein
MDLSSVLSDLLRPTPGSDVAHAPEPGAGLLPALSMAGAAPAPSAPAGTVAPQPMPMPSGSGQGGGNLIRDLAPILIAAVTGARNPLHGAAIAHGSYAGMMAAQQENLEAEQRDEQKRMLAGRFLQQTASDVLRLPDPLARQNYLQLAEQIGVQQFGMPEGWTKQIAAHDAKQDIFATLKTELSEKLAAFDKDKKWASVAGTPGEAKISFRLSNGQTVPVNMARQLVGQAMYDSSGAQAFAPEPTTEGKTEQERAASLLAGIRTAKARGDVKKAAELQAAYDDLIAVKRDLEKPTTPQSIDAALLDAYRKGDTAEVDRLLSLKRRSGDAGRSAQVSVTIPGLTGMTAADRVESAAQDIIARRLAPSQLATFFTGMGKESASQLRSLVMPRVKQIDPEFNFAEAESNFQYGKNTGVQASIRFSKSVQESIPLLIAQAKKLGNGNIRSLNALINAGKNQFSDVDLKKFQTAATLVADEIAKILQGGGTGTGTSDAKLRQAEGILNTSDSPAAIAGALETVNELIGFRVKAQTAGTFMENAPGGTKSKATLRYNPVTGKLEPNK